MERVDHEFHAEAGDLAGRTTTASSSSSPACSKLGTLPTLMVEKEDRMSGSATYTTEHAIAFDSADEDTPIECLGVSHTEQYEVQEESERIEAEAQLGRDHSVLTRTSML